MAAPLLNDAEPLSVDRGALGALILHGFTGTPRSMRPLATAFVESDWSVELPLLPGHGTAPEDLVDKTYADWLAAADAALARLTAHGGPTVIVGHSMGGTLTLSLAFAHHDIAGIILINPMVEPPAPAFLELMRAALASGTEMMPTIGSDIAHAGASGGGYDATPIRPMISLLEATGEVAPRLSDITCPALLFSSRVDHVVPVASSDLVEREFGGPIERVFLENSYHVALLDNDAEEVEKRSTAFVEQVANG